MAVTFCGQLQSRKDYNLLPLIHMQRLQHHHQRNKSVHTMIKNIRLDRVFLLEMDAILGMPQPVLIPVTNL